MPSKECSHENADTSGCVMVVCPDCETLVGGCKHGPPSDYKMTVNPDPPGETRWIMMDKIVSHVISVPSCQTITETYVVPSVPKFSVGDRVIEKEIQDIFTIYDVTYSLRYNKWLYSLDMGTFVSEMARTEEDLEGIDE